MRTISFTGLVMIISATLSSAQTERGRWQIGTQIDRLSYTNNGTKSSKQFSGGIIPSVGYFIAKNVVFGAGIPLSLSTSRDQGVAAVYGGYDAKSSITGVGIAPFMRYYVGDAKLKLFLGISYSYVLNKATYQSYTGNRSAVNGHTTILSPHMGLEYFITRKVALNATLGYNVRSRSSSFLVSSPYAVDPGPTVTTKSFDFSLGFHLFFGR